MNGFWILDALIICVIIRELDGRVVHMGNDSSCKTVGICSIRLKNHDGSIRVLIDVWYVPNLRMNLISLGTLEDKGFAVSMRDGILIVTSGALMVMKGTRKDNLFYFQNDTIIGIIATISNEDVDLETTRL